MGNDGNLTAGDVLRDHLKQKSWGQADLAQVIGKTTAAVNEIIQGKRAISSEMAMLLAAAFGTTAEFWLTLDAEGRVAEETIEEARSRSRLYGLAPIREMVRRGWIQPTTNDLEDLERELKRFFHADSLDQLPPLTVATRRSEPCEPPSASQLAWCRRAYNLAADLIVPPFDQSRVEGCCTELRKLLAFAPEAQRVPRVLTDHGIRFVIVEHLAGSKIDGAAMWIDDEKPVIAVSIRMDRIDSFWFTLFHELSHIRHRDGLSIDSCLVGEDAEFPGMKPDFERRADEESAQSLIPTETLKSFIHRVAPMYSKERIVQFAHRIRVHPGIIVGQLQHLGEMKYRSNREMLIKVRQRVTAVAVVDGWGHNSE